jgi:hypothetical protein
LRKTERDDDEGEFQVGLGWEREMVSVRRGGLSGMEEAPRVKKVRVEGKTKSKELIRE